MSDTRETESRSNRGSRLIGRSLLIASVATALVACAQTKPTQMALTDCAGSGAACGNQASIDDIVTGSLPSGDAPGTERVDIPILADGSKTIPEKTVDRSAVLAQVASASPDLPATVAPRGTPTVIPPASPSASTSTPASSKANGRTTVPMLSLNDAVAIAVLSHPQMGAQAAKVQGTAADVRYAEGARLPSVEVYAGVGHATLGTYTNYPTMFNSGNTPGTVRADTGFTFRQLVFDFGAARAEIQRNEALVDSERLKLADQAEDIALRTVNAYLNLLEQSELIALIDHTVSEQRKLAELVKLSQQNGNGTVADVDRIKAKVIEIEAMRTDIDTAYHTALDEFHRLTSLQPRQVRRPKSIASLIPKTVILAVNEARTSNPSLLSLRSTAMSLGHQLAGQEAQRLPRVDLQSDGLVKNYMGGVASANQSVVDMRAMVMFTYKLYDGGMGKAQIDHIRATQQANEFKQLDEQETVELNLRRFYQSLSANRAKRAAAASGVSTADNVNKLYIEQFKAGKRTIFEVLDSNMMVFTMQKNRINGEFEELRATYGILRNMGRLGETIARS